MDEALHKAARQGQDAFWKAAARRLKERIEEKPMVGTAFQALSAELRQGLPATPQAQAMELSHRLQERIRDLGHSSLAEQAKDAPQDPAKPIDPTDLDSAARRRSAAPWSFLPMLHRLLLDAGLKPRLALVTRREAGQVDPTELNLGQFSDMLLGIEEPGKPFLWLDPQRHYAEPGLIASGLQGCRAMVMDLADLSHTVIALPVQAPECNRRDEAYQMELLPDQDRFSLKATFQGLEDAVWRESLRPFGVEERARNLTEQLEERCPEVLVDLAETGKAEDLRQPLEWRLTGRLGRAAGRFRLVDPFPLSQPLLSLPADLPAQRTQAISLNHLAEQRLHCRFKVPPGYHWLGQPALERSNDFGSVRYAVEPAQAGPGAEVTASLTVQIKTLETTAQQWEAFREFVGWLRVAQNTRLRLEVAP